MTEERNIEDYTRVTEVLYPFTNLKTIDPEVLKNAAERGTAVHKLCDFLAYNIGIMPGDLENLVESYTIKVDRSAFQNQEHYKKEKKLVEAYVESFKKWYVNKKFMNKLNRFFDDDLMITGECDLLYRNDQRELVLVDLKTPMNESHTWLLQGSAYSYMAKKIGHDIQVIEFVKLSRYGEIPKVFTYQEDFDLFRCHLKAYLYSFKNLQIEHHLDYL